MGGQFAKKGPNNLAMQQVRARAASGARALRMAPTVSRWLQRCRGVANSCALKPCVSFFGRCARASSRTRSRRSRRSRRAAARGWWGRACVECTPFVSGEASRHTACPAPCARTGAFWRARGHLALPRPLPPLPRPHLRPRPLPLLLPLPLPRPHSLPLAFSRGRPASASSPPPQRPRACTKVGSCAMCSPCSTPRRCTGARQTGHRARPREKKRSKHSPAHSCEWFSDRSRTPARQRTLHLSFSPRFLFLSLPPTAPPRPLPGGGCRPGQTKNPPCPKFISFIKSRVLSETMFLTV